MIIEMLNNSNHVEMVSKFTVATNDPAYISMTDRPVHTAAKLAKKPVFIFEYIDIFKVHDDI